MDNDLRVFESRMVGVAAGLDFLQAFNLVRLRPKMMVATVA
jgi:hypothetical protein